MKNEKHRNEELKSAELEEVQGGAQAFPVADRPRWRLQDGGTVSPDPDGPIPDPGDKLGRTDEEISQGGTRSIG